jgi:hypothetical protein
LSPRQREEVLNVLLAVCISERGMVAAPETIVSASAQARALPDVIVTFLGLRCAIEGKFGDVQNARAQVEADATNRVETGIAYLAVGVVYPQELRSVLFSSLKDAISEAVLDFLVCSEAGSNSWRSGSIGTILEELRRSYDLLVTDDVLARSVDRLQSGMQDMVNVLTQSPASAVRLATLLGVYDPDEEDSRDDGR